MPLRQGLLGLISKEPCSGYDLSKTFNQSLQHFWKAQTSQIYRELTQMERDGLLESEIVLQTGSPNRKVYHLTPKGRDELQQWLEQDTGEVASPVRDEFLLRLFFSGEQSRERVLHLLRQFRRHNEEALRAMQDTAETIENHAAPDCNDALCWKMVQNYGQRVLSLNIEWADNNIRQLENDP